MQGVRFVQSCLKKDMYLALDPFSCLAAISVRRHRKWPPKVALLQVLKSVYIKMRITDRITTKTNALVLKFFNCFSLKKCTNIECVIGGESAP